MAIFEYNALTVNDRVMKGTIEAGSHEQAHQTLQDMQLKVNSITKIKAAGPRPVGRDDFLLFNQQLASITKTGIPLERALKELSNDIASRKMRTLINEIAQDLERGTDIVEAFEKRQKSFPPLYGQVLKTGIETGRLSEMLTSLNRNLEIAGQTRKIIFEATAYPIIILIIAFVLISGILVFIVPGFETVLDDMLSREHLNPITNMFFLMSRNVFGIWIVAALVMATMAMAYFLLNRSAAGRRKKESLLLRIPVFGRLYQSSILAKMAETSAMLVGSGAQMPTVLRLGSNSSGSEKLRFEASIIADQVEQGTSIIEAGQFCRTLPRLFLYSIQLAGQRNELQESLNNLSQMYSEQVRCWQMRLETILLPLMLVFVGGFIFIMISAMFLPMIQIISALGG